MSKTKHNPDESLRTLILEAAKKEGSVNQVAKNAGVPQSSLSAWLTGAQNGLSWSLVSRLCAHYGWVLSAPNGRRKK